MPTPRVAAIHDLSGFGRCSLTVALPVLSVMGVQCCPLPTACLSTHTGGFEHYTFLDMSEEMPRIAAHWASLNLEFRGIYSGFLGSAQQISLVSEFIRTFRRGDTIVVVDPVMGDNGAVYQTYTPELCAGMTRLAEQADVITPNLTEAALLLGIPYGELPAGKDGLRKIVTALSLNGRRSVVLTGASTAPDLTGAMYFDAQTRTTDAVQVPLVPQNFCGTGDLFASVLTGALVRGRSLPESVRQAAEFVHACCVRTAQQGLPVREGPDFEPLLHLLAQTP